MSDPIEDALTLLASRVPGVEPYRWLAPGDEPCYCETQEEPPFHPGWVHSLLCTQSRNDYEAVGDCIRAVRLTVEETWALEPCKLSGIHTHHYNGPHSLVPPIPPCSDHNPNSGPGSDQCMACGEYAALSGESGEPKEPREP
jgi:hypothetical protein